MNEEGIPFDPCGAVIYHCGPVIQGDRIIAAGPTTSARMNALSDGVIRSGVRALVGKGGMSPHVTALLRGRGVYLAFTGGCAALAASRMTLRGVYFEDLGMAEAIWVIELDELPLVVGVDAHGKDIFADVGRKAQVLFDARFNRNRGYPA
jgi:fumarate hydratase subunit beta